jgi:Putative beta barrel porin-7 (BBP7)
MIAKRPFGAAPLDFYVSTQGIGSASFGQIAAFHDGFAATNNFNGAQLGIRAEANYGLFWAQASLKAALGDMYQQLSINGSGLTTAGTVFFPVTGGAGNNLAGGIFAQPSNIGSYGSNELSGLAEVGLRLGYRLTDRIVPYIGYNALYVGSVLRPGTAVNPNINTITTPLAAASRASGFSIPVGGPAGPTVETRSTDVWTQGISVGLTISL